VSVPDAPIETFSQKLRRLAHELHKMPLDAEPGKAFPAARKGLQGDARADAIARGEDPDERQPGEEG